MLSNLVYCVASTSTYFLISQAAVVRLPLSDHKFLTREEQKTAFSKWPHAAQPVLQTEAGSAPLSDISVFGYGVDVTIGTPPQTIHAILDINWDTFVVQDTKCQSYSCESGNETAFNSSASTSYQPTHQHSRLVYANAIFEGSIAEDTLNVNGIAIPGQTFLDATEIRSRTFIDFYFGYRAMLGFAPASGRRAAFPSPWESLVDNGLVDRDVFSIVPIPGLRHPYEPRTGGELVLGGYPTGLDEKDALHLPLKSSTKYPWATSLESMSVGNLTTFYNTDEATAYFLTTWPSIFVPRRFGKQLMLWLGNLEPFGILFQKFDCEKRDKFPDWTFGIGGRNISLGPFQYTFELNVTGDDGVETVCLLGMLPEDGDGDVVGLGWPFWESFRGLAFERDNRRISLFL